MAKPATLQIKLVSTADTGYFYVTKKNPRTKPEKLELKTTLLAFFRCGNNLIYSCF